MMPRWMVSVVIILVIGALIASAQDLTFPVSVGEIYADVLVLENKKPVSGLKAADFEIFDNGVAQEIQYISLRKQTPISAILVFDMSRSVAGELLEHLRDAAFGLLNDLKDGDQAALIAFSNSVVLGSPLTRNFSGIKLALNQVNPVGNSSLLDGSYAGLVLADSLSEPTLLILLSDGRDTSSWLTSEAVLETAKNTRHNDVVVYAVSTAKMQKNSFVWPKFEIGSGDRSLDNPFLRQLTKATGGSLVEIESEHELSSAFHSILEEFRLRYLIHWVPRGVSSGGWHKVEVRVKRPSATVKARPGYTLGSQSK
jgi:VWFA-related protein